MASAIVWPKMGGLPKQMAINKNGAGVPSNMKKLELQGFKGMPNFISQRMASGTPQAVVTEAPTALVYSIFFDFVAVRDFPKDILYMCMWGHGDNILLG